MHTSRAVPRSWVLLRTANWSRAQPAQVARSASAGSALSQRRSLAQRAHVTRSACAYHAHAGHALVATCPGSLPQVATSKLQVVTPNFNRPGRDLKSMSRPASAPPTETPLSRPKTLVTTPNHHKAARIISRHQIDVATPLRSLQVATSKRGRDTVSPAQPPSQVATSFFFSRSRPPGASPMSRHRFHVATSFLPIVGLPGRDTEIHVATSHTAAHVATSNPCHDAVLAQLKQSRSRRHFLVATSRPTKLGPIQPSQVATPNSGSDLKLLLKASSMSQPQNPSCNTLKPKPVPASTKPVQLLPCTKIFYFIFFQILQ